MAAHGPNVARGPQKHSQKNFKSEMSSNFSQ